MFPLMRVAQTLVLVSSFTPTLSLMAADDGHGRLALQGSIVDTPCSIEVGDLLQELDMGNMSVSEMKRIDTGNSLPFNIGVRNCDLGAIREGGSNTYMPTRRIRIVFDGVNDAGYFAVSGTASGVALMIRDEFGQEMAPGGMVAPVPMPDGDMDLNYTVTMVKNGQGLQAGSYRAAVNFRIEYF